MLKMTVLLVVYIHQNPVKAGIIEEAAKYRWSSYAEYVSQKPFVTDIDLVLDLLHPNRKEAVAMFKEFMIKENEDKCLGYESYKEKRMSDKDVRQLIQKLIKSDDIQVIQQMSRNERNKALRHLKEMDISINSWPGSPGCRRIIEKANRRAETSLSPQKRIDGQRTRREVCIIDGNGNHRAYALPSTMRAGRGEHTNAVSVFEDVI